MVTDKNINNGVNDECNGNNQDRDEDKNDDNVHDDTPAPCRTRSGETLCQEFSTRQNLIFTEKYNW